MASPSSSPGAVHVHVKPNPRPVVLALVGYESVKWQVTVDADVRLRAVILSGYHKHSVQGLPPGVPVLKCTAPGSISTRMRSTNVASP